MPPISWFVLISDYRVVLLDRHAHFEKGSYRNRCRIAGPNGTLTLSVPLVHGKHQHKPMGEVLISYLEPWQKIHWMTLCSCYRRSPYFEFFEDIFYKIFHTKYETLIELNYALLQVFIGYIKVNTSFSFTQQYIEYSTGEIDDKRNFILPKKDTGNLALKVPAYNQVFSDRFEFQRDLSIFDLLCNMGKYQF